MEIAFLRRGGGWILRKCIPLFQIELGEKTTQLHSHKESNFKLTHGIEEAIKKIEQKNQQIDEIHLKIETDSR